MIHSKILKHQQPNLIKYNLIILITLLYVKNLQMQQMAKKALNPSKPQSDLLQLM